MILIGENIHVISKSVQNALLERDKQFISDLIEIQKDMDFIDLNVGPAKKNLEGVLPWLANLVKQKSDIGISFDTTNLDEMERGLASFDGKTFINSTNNDVVRLEKMTDLAVNFDSNLVALTLSKDTGIPKTFDGRMEIAFEIYEKCLEKGVESDKIYFDPLILPVSVEQSQALEALNTIKIIKESFEPEVRTLVGLSNISNGCPKQIRPLVNRVFAVLCFGARLDAAIVDAKDNELIRILKMLEGGNPNSDIDKLYVSLANMVENFGELEEVEFDRSSSEQARIIKTAEILLNKQIYSHSFTQI